MSAGDCKEVVDADGELQWRQVHPKFVDGGLVSRDAFVGTPAARGEVSTARSSIVTAADAYDFHRNTLSLESAGTWGVTVAEVGLTQCLVIDDSQCDGVDAPGHSYIDMTDLSRAESRKARSVLASLATDRGRRHPLESTEPA